MQSELEKLIRQEGLDKFRPKVDHQSPSQKTPKGPSIEPSKSKSKKAAETTTSQAAPKSAAVSAKSTITEAKKPLPTKITFKSADDYEYDDDIPLPTNKKKTSTAHPSEPKLEDEHGKKKAEKESGHDGLAKSIGRVQLERPWFMVLDGLLATKKHSSSPDEAVNKNSLIL